MVFIMAVCLVFYFKPTLLRVRILVSSVAIGTTSTKTSATLSTKGGTPASRSESSDEHRFLVMVFGKVGEYIFFLSL